MGMPFITRCVVYCLLDISNIFQFQDIKECSGFSQSKLISEAIQKVWFANKMAPRVIFSSNFKPISFMTLALVLTTVCPPFVAHSSE
jgi:Domain of unknown function (DUF6532)